MTAPALVALALALLPAVARGADAAPEPPDHALARLTGPRLARHVEVLASDAFAGRFPGTAGETRTVAYLAAAFARAGLAAPYDGGYLQEVPLRAHRVEPDARLVVRRADGAGELELAFPDDVLLAGPPDGGSHRLRASEVVFVGHGVHAPDAGWDDYAGADVAGRTVLALWGEPPGFGDGGSRHGTPAGKRAAAAAHDAAALLLVPDGGASGLPWALYADHAAQPAHRLADDAPPPAPGDGLPRGTLHVDRARELLALAGADLDALREAAATPAGATRALPLRVDLDVTARSWSVRTHNVVGVLRGSEHPDECVLYTAHWDHVGEREHGDGDRVFNGAVDNATGTAALIELAATFASLEPRPERSIVFLATTAEEQGLLGAHWHAEHPLVPLGNVVAVINMDALFPFGATKGLTVVGAGRSELDAYLDAAARRVGRRTYPDPAPEQGAFYRSDHYPFAQRGVPAIFAVGGPALDPDAGETADLQRWAEYGAEHYHRPSDEYDADRWDMDGIVQDVRGYLHVGWRLANTRAFPNWYADDELRALRDAQRAAVTGGADARRADGG